MELFPNLNPLPSPQAAGQSEDFDPFTPPDIDDVQFRGAGDGGGGKLTVINPNPAYEYRWVADSPTNIRIKYDLGYRLVPEGTQAVTDHAGATPRLNSGMESDGSGQTMVLMFRPVTFRHKQDEILRGEVANNQKSIDPKKAGGADEVGVFSGEVGMTSS